jgi:hypothetical protein
MMSRIAVIVGLLAAPALLHTSPVSAQCRLCDTPTSSLPTAKDRGQVDLQIESRLDFDTLATVGNGGGTATLSPNGARSTSGNIVGINGRAMVGSASVRGKAGELIRIDMPKLIRMHSISGAAITMDEIVTDLPSLPRLDAQGNLHFRFGGRLRVEGDVEGEFRGDVPIMIDYL